MSDQPRSRRLGWQIVREGDAEPEYFAGSIFSPSENWTRDSDRAYQFLKRSAAATAMVVNALDIDPLVRIVPVFVSAE